MRIITFKKIDRRYNGGNIYQYMIETHGMNSRDQIKTFNEIRQWCEVIWGRSYELHDAWAHDEGWPIWKHIIRLGPNNITVSKITSVP